MTLTSKPELGVSTKPAIESTERQRKAHKPLYSVRDVIPQTLPSLPQEHPVWTKVKLHPDFHVTSEKCRYSAPSRLIGKDLWLRATLQWSKSTSNTNSSLAMDALRRQGESPLFKTTFLQTPSLFS